MTASIESMYEEIGRRITEKIPGTWTRAQVVARETDLGVRNVEGMYEDGSGQQKGFIVGPQITRLLTEVESILYQPDTPRWKSITFTLEHDGHFNLHFEE